MSPFKNLDDSLESSEPPVMLGDVAVTSQGVGCGSVILDADVPGLSALHLDHDISVRCHGSQCHLVKLGDNSTVHPNQALQVRGRA